MVVWVVSGSSRGRLGVRLGQPRCRCGLPTGTPDACLSWLRVSYPMCCPKKKWGTQGSALHCLPSLVLDYPISASRYPIVASSYPIVAPGRRILARVIACWPPCKANLDSRYPILTAGYPNLAFGSPHLDFKLPQFDYTLPHLALESSNITQCAASSQPMLAATYPEVAACFTVGFCVVSPVPQDVHSWPQIAPWLATAHPHRGLKPAMLALTLRPLLTLRASFQRQLHTLSPKAKREGNGQTAQAKPADG